MTGYIGLTDFRGEVIRAFQDAGWIFYGEVTIWKNPQAQSIRTKAHALTFQSQEPRLGGQPARARRLPADLQEARRQRGPDPA